MEDYEELVTTIVNDRIAHEYFCQYLIQCANDNSDWEDGNAIHTLRYSSKRAICFSLFHDMSYENRLAAAQELKNQLAEPVSHELDPDLNYKDRQLLIEFIKHHTTDAFGAFEDYLVGRLNIESLPDEILEHIENANNHLTNANRKYKEALMNNVPFKTVNYVFGQDIKEMSEDQLLDAIRTVEKEIESYTSIKTRSKKVEKRKEELTAALEQIVEALDAK